MKKYFILVWLLLIIISHTIIHTNKNNGINDYLEQKTEQRHLEYKAIYNNYKTFADMIFKTIVNTDKVINIFANRDRKKLMNYLNDDYKELRKFSIRQLHFHLPNNDSFLRMHRPNKYGDNLTKARLTVKYVNENKKFIDGFEEGKIFNGFRFVYPLFDNSKDKKHIGSVEVSYSALFFIKEMIHSYKVTSNFFIDKDVVGQKVFNSEKSNYSQSPYDKYLVQNSIIKLQNIDISKIKLSDKFITQVYAGLKAEKPFSMLFNNNINKIITYIPLQNPINKKMVAILSVKTTEDFIQRKETNSRLIFLLSIIIISIALLFIYKQLQYQHKLNEDIDDKTKELELEILKIKELEDEKLNQQGIMLKREKMAALGDMIGNIAHQWRQPLSVISTGVTGMQMQKEYNSLSDEQFNNTCDAINENAQYLSKTIDDFSDFIKGDRVTKIFILSDEINSFLHLIEGATKNNYINIILDIEEEIKIDGYQNELTQCLINIFNNAKDAFENTDDIDKLIFLSTSIKDSKAIISIKDNAGGIPEDIINKVFEPYFTTKHKSQGTGIGLHMTYNLIVDGMKGSIVVNNDTYTYDSKQYTGAEFLIILPLS